MSTRESTMQLVRQLTRTASAVHAHGDRAATRAGQSLARWQVLDTFADTRRTVPAAARRLRQSRQSAQRIVDLLAAEGLLDAHDNPDHRTSPLYGVTPAGRATLERLDLSATDWLEFIGARMDTREMRQLIDSLSRLSQIADEYEPRPAVG